MLIATKFFSFLDQSKRIEKICKIRKRFLLQELKLYIKSEISHAYVRKQINIEILRPLRIQFLL